MYARVVTVAIQAGRMDEALNIVRDSILPAAQQQEGFRGYLLLTNAEANKAINITMWETESAMTAGEASGYYQEQVAKIAHTFAGKPAMEHYSISVQA